MIAIDTNVLLRYLLDDDKNQSRRASALIKGGEEVLITDVVLAETTWTLKGQRYGLGKEAIVRVINALFEEASIFFEDDQTVWRAVNDYKNAKTVKSGGKKKEADFSDALIVNKALHTAKETGNEFNGAYTFDVAAQQIQGAEKP